MKRLYTLEEIHRYAAEIRQTDEDFWTAIQRHDVEAKNQLHAQVEVMREVLLHMHENLEKYGPYRPGFFGRWAAAREIRKLSKQFQPSALQADITNQSK